MRVFVFCTVLYAKKINIPIKSVKISFVPFITAGTVIAALIGVKFL
jgi:hypothetical protein